MPANLRLKEARPSEPVTAPAPHSALPLSLSIKFCARSATIYAKFAILAAKSPRLGPRECACFEKRASERASCSAPRTAAPRQANFYGKPIAKLCVVFRSRRRRRRRQRVVNNDSMRFNSMIIIINNNKQQRSKSLKDEERLHFAGSLNSRFFKLLKF